MSMAGLPACSRSCSKQSSHLTVLSPIRAVLTTPTGSYVVFAHLKSAVRYSEKRVFLIQYCACKRNEDCILAMLPSYKKYNLIPFLMPTVWSTKLLCYANSVLSIGKTCLDFHVRRHHCTTDTVPCRKDNPWLYTGSWVQYKYVRTYVHVIITAVPSTYMYTAYREYRYG